MTGSWVGNLALFFFFLILILVALEKQIQMRRSKPTVFFACLTWGLIGVYEVGQPGGHAEEAVHHLTGSIAQLFFFVFVAMVFINTLEERGMFDQLRARLVRRGLDYRQLFWATGTITFLISPLVDNLTSALLIGRVAQAIGGTNVRFIVPAFVNIVVAANAGGTWSPFGDITTLMIWMSGKIESYQFPHLFVPALCSWLVPAVIMQFAIPEGKPEGPAHAPALKHGAKVILGLGLFTIFLALFFHHVLGLLPYLGMMFGLGILMSFAYYLLLTDRIRNHRLASLNNTEPPPPFNIFGSVARVEFDTLLFFFGSMLMIGALDYLGYISLASQSIFGGHAPMTSNVIMGVISAVVDNIPALFAVVQMNPAMGPEQWLLATLSIGVGGSLLSIGSVAGVVVMGVNPNYNFVSHLKWTPAIAAGYIAGIVSWWLLLS